MCHELTSTPPHRVGVSFPEGRELLPFYTDPARRRRLPCYAKVWPVTLPLFTQSSNFASARCTRISSAAVMLQHSTPTLTLTVACPTVGERLRWRWWLHEMAASPDVR